MNILEDSAADTFHSEVTELTYLIFFVDAKNGIMIRRSIINIEFNELNFLLMADNDAVKEIREFLRELFGLRESKNVLNAIKSQIMEKIQRESHQDHQR